MTGIDLQVLVGEVKACCPVRPVGRVKAIEAGAVVVSGLSDTAALSDAVEIIGEDEAAILGEIVRLTEGDVTVLPDGNAVGLQIGDEVTLLGQLDIAPHPSWLGRVIDPYGKALDHGPLLRGVTPYPLRGATINPTERRSLGARLDTGMKVFNTLLPVVRGQRLGLFAGSGVGKSTLLGRMALGVAADVVVIALVGERGREVQEFVDRVIGPEGMQRAVVVAATSDTSPMARRRCAWAAMAVAEYFRDEGNQVLFLADSVTRFADAHREIAAVAGEATGNRGYPVSTTQLITGLCERAGPGAGFSGDITAIFTVLVAGSDMDEPIADILRGVLDGHVVLDRKIAERGRFPAIDVLRSVSRSLPDAATPEENKVITQARKLLGAYDRSEMMIQAGLYTAGSDSEVDAAIKSFPKLDTFVSMREPNGISSSFKSLSESMPSAGILHGQ